MIRRSYFDPVEEAYPKLSNKRFAHILLVVDGVAPASCRHCLLRQNGGRDIRVQPARRRRYVVGRLQNNS